MSIKEILSFTSKRLSMQDKDFVFNIIPWLDCDYEDISKINLIDLFKLAQEILKYKGEQVCCFTVQHSKFFYFFFNLRVYYKSDIKYGIFYAIHFW